MLLTIGRNGLHEEVYGPYEVQLLMLQGKVVETTKWRGIVRPMVSGTIPIREVCMPVSRGFKPRR
jgi:hypothetical protein